jgi:hypothetical protein
VIENWGDPFTTINLFLGSNTIQLVGLVPFYVAQHQRRYYVNSERMSMDHLSPVPI